MKQEYLDNVNLERDNRRQMLKCFHAETSKTTAIVNRFLGIRDKPINFIHLITLFKIHEWIEVNDKVKFKLIEFNNSEAIFDTEMKRNGAFGGHRHDDCIEIAEVLKGVLFDVDSDKTYYKGDVLTIEAGKKHTPVALENTVLKVTFKKV